MWSPGRRSLRATIVTSVVAIFACVLLLSGGATVFALKRSLVGQLDRDLDEASARDIALLQEYAQRPRWAQDGALPWGSSEGAGTLRSAPGTGARSLNLILSTAGDGTVEVLRNTVVTADNTVGALSQQQLQGVLEQSDSADTFRATLDLGPDVGEYRVQVIELSGTPDQDEGVTRVITGLPLSGVDETTRQAILILVPMGVAALLLAGGGAAYLVRRNLAPLDRVAATARTVSGQQLSQGEVALAHRVPEADTDPSTEVGQVGQALNSLLDTMESALSSRHASEQRVRQFVADASHELRTPLASIRG